MTSGLRGSPGPRWGHRSMRRGLRGSPGLWGDPRPMTSRLRRSPGPWWGHKSMRRGLWGSPGPWRRGSRGLQAHGGVPRPAVGTQAHEEGSPGVPRLWGGPSPAQPHVDRGPGVVAMVTAPCEAPPPHREAPPHRGPASWAELSRELAGRALPMRNRSRARSCRRLRFGLARHELPLVSALG